MQVTIQCSPCGEMRLAVEDNRLSADRPIEGYRCTACGAWQAKFKSIPQPKVAESRAETKKVKAEVKGPNLFDEMDKEEG